MYLAGLGRAPAHHDIHTHPGETCNDDTVHHSMRSTLGTGLKVSTSGGTAPQNIYEASISAA